MIKTSLIILFIFGISGKAFSQYMTIPDSITLIDEVFITAPQKLYESGSKITRIDTSVISSKLISDMGTLLSENSSIFVKSNGQSSISTASMRGTNASHTQVLWNNVPMNSPILGMVDLSIIPTFIVDNINIYHGASSLLKKGGALGGVVDLTTTKPWQNKPDLSIISSYGSYNSHSNAATFSFGSDNFHSVTKLYILGSDNDFEFENKDIYNGGLEKQQNADYLQKGFVQEIYYKMSPNSTASIKAWYQLFDRGIPTLTTNQSGFNNNISRQNDENLVLSTNYTFGNQNGTLSINSGANMQNMNFEHKNYVNGVGMFKAVDSQSEVFSSYNSINYSYIGFDSFELSAEAGYNYHNVKSYESIKNEGYDTTRHEILMAVSAFTEILKNTRTGFIVRQEMYDDKISGIIPSFFAEYNLSQQLNIRASIARNTKYPNLNELYFTPGGNPDLLHERGWQVESGIEYNYISDNFRIKPELTAYYSKINDWILWRPTNMGFWQPENIDLVVAKGVELSTSLIYNYKNWKLTAICNYALTSAINQSEPFGPNDQSVGKQLPYTPEHSANMFIKTSFKNFYLTYQWNYFSERYTGSASEPGILVSIYPYYMNDVSIGKNLSINNVKANIGFYIYNLFNESYRSVLWQPMPGRNYRVQLNITI